MMLQSGQPPALVDPRICQRLADLDLPFQDKLDFAAEPDSLNHRIFRFPARFHPPVVRRLLELYSQPRDIVLDPFCGSGTVAVEALFSGRAAVATDIDPLSVLVTHAKARTYDLGVLAKTVAVLHIELERMQAADQRLWGSFEHDIGPITYDAAAAALALYIPDLPNARHWFRRRVTVQLAAIRSKIEAYTGGAVSPFLRLCFASILRNASNADPVPVSGLEVTRHMRDREAAGRAINPYELYRVALGKALDGTRRFQEQRVSGGSARVARADARQLSVRGTGIVDCILTSPPYLTAVDYYRRHTLEMYWLGLTGSASDRLALLPGYLGRDRVSARHITTDDTPASMVARRWLADMPAVRPERQRGFLHYCTGMTEVLSRLVEIARAGAPVIIVVGDVRFGGVTVSMKDLFEQLAPSGLVLERTLWYPLVNRFMSYERQNGADIDMDRVLVFRAT